jgi:hypothetical protein
LDGTLHTVELEHAYWSNKRILRVDGERIRTETRDKSLIFPLGSEHRFRIGAHECAVVITRSNLFLFRHD